MAFFRFLCSTLFRYFHVLQLVQSGEELLSGNGIKFVFRKDKWFERREEVKRLIIQTPDLSSFRVCPFFGREGDFQSEITKLRT